MSVFELDRGRAALEKWAVLNHLTVQVYDVDGRPVAGPVNRTMLFDLFSRGRGPGMFVRCVHECLGQSDPGAPVVIEEEYGLAVIGTPLVSRRRDRGGGGPGYALTTHLTYREVVRLARDYRLPSTRSGRWCARNCRNRAGGCRCAASCWGSSATRW